jgi:trigger factor
LNAGGFSLKTTVSEPESWKRVIEIEVPEPEVDAAVDVKLRALRRDARLPGFRPGKVPIAVVKQRFGKSARAEAVEEVMQGAFKAACEEHRINPIGEAKLTDMLGEAGAALRFTIEAEVDPPAEITGYDKLKVRAKPAKVTDSMVDTAFDELIEQYAEFNDAGRPAKKGDYMRIRYKSVAIDGADRPDLKDHSPGYPIELGGEGVFKEFDKGLAGRSAGDEAEISVKFPKDYGDTGVAGKPGEFVIEVLAVLEKRLPELNEAFLKQFGDFATVDALKEAVRKDLEAEKLRLAKKSAYDEAIQALIKENNIELAPSNIDTFAKMLKDDHLKQSNMAETDLSEENLEMFRNLSVLLLKRMKIVDYVADKERIKATQDEVDAEITLLAQGYGHDFNALKQQFRKDGTANRIRTEIRERKTLDFLIGEGGAD